MRRAVNQEKVTPTLIKHGPEPLGGGSHDGLPGLKAL